MTRAHVASLLVFSSLVGATLYAADERSPDTREVTNAGGGDYYVAWRASKNALAQAPDWDGRGEPPLSIGAAVEIARKYLASRGSEAAEAAVRQVRLEHGYSAFEDYLPEEQRPEYFIYRVEFAGPVGAPLWKPERFVVVLLDGSVVVPTITFR